MKKLLLIQPGAFGDIFLCAPIAKWYADRGYEVHWPVREKFISTLEYFDYVKPILLSEESLHSDWLRSDVMKILPMINGYDKVINLADRGPHPTAQRPGENFEQCKYRLAQVPLGEKNNLSWTRNLSKERELLSIINPPEKYVVAHLTNSQGDRDSMPEQDLPVVEICEKEGFTICDWFSIIEKAERVYCVESAIHQFLDGTLKTYNQNFFLLKRGSATIGTRYTCSFNWNLEFIGKDTTIKG